MYLKKLPYPFCRTIHLLHVAIAATEAAVGAAEDGAAAATTGETAKAAR